MQSVFREGVELHRAADAASQPLRRRGSGGSRALQARPGSFCRCLPARRHEKVAQELIAFNAQVGAEDDVLTDSVQRGLRGGLPERGRLLTNSEHLVIHFQKLVLGALTGNPTAPTPKISSSPL